MNMVSDGYGRLVRFHERWKALIQIALGAVWTATSILLAVVAFNVWGLEEARDQGHRKEARTVRIACVRAQAFGPPFIQFLERAEAKLRLGVLTQTIAIDGKREPVISFYRSTIPPSCPSK